MTARVEFAYAQARLQAHHGAMAGQAIWQALDASRTAGHFFTVARAGPLARWIDGVDERADAHRIERHLRARWRQAVAEVARWLPRRWQAATRWFEALPELPLLDELQRGAPAVVGWLQADSRLAASAVPDVAARAQALHGTGLDVLSASPAEGGDVATRWLAAWRERLPRDAGDVALLCRPVELLMPHLRAGAAARGVDAAPTRRALTRLFRHHAATAVAVFAHLALVGLEVERLRGGLLVRVLFDTGREPLAV
jgi:hypothetical protein